MLSRVEKEDFLERYLKESEYYLERADESVSELGQEKNLSLSREYRGLAQVMAISLLGEE